jgi:D-alanyl-lipoteichoic acid acyltransferase DltB (MBOAT superfamily)
VSAPIPFLEFSLAVVLAYYAVPWPLWRRGILLLANLVFLATFSQGLRSYVPFAAFLAFGYAGVLLIRRAPRRAFLPVLVATLAAFIWLKKYAFVPASLDLRFLYVTVGLSYILFRILHLMIDTRNGALPDKIGPLAYFSYTANFATLALGPIQRYQDYASTRRQAEGGRLSAGAAGVAIERIIKGLFKTNVLALVFSTVQTRAIEAVTLGPGPAGKFFPGSLALVLYGLFIYCNFSGFIDLVIGVGLLFGITFPENFKRPLFADNFLDFWTNRWHITLSAWLRTYVYNPLLLSLMRRYPARKLEPIWTVAVFFITFFLVGVWHGQTSEFMFYGLLLGLGVSVNKAYQLLIARQIGRKQYAKLASEPLYIALSRGLTFTYFTFSLIWFWSNWHQIGALEAALGWGMTASIFAGIFAGSTIVLAAWEAAHQWALATSWNSDPALSQCSRIAMSAALLVITLAISLFMNQPAPDIVYKAF